MKAIKSSIFLLLIFIGYFAFKFINKKKDIIKIDFFDRKLHAEGIEKIFLDCKYWVVYDIPNYSIEERMFSQKVNIDFEKNIFADLSIKVATYKNRVVGFVTYYVHNEVGTIQIIAVDKNSRRMGIGKKLMEEAINDLMKKNIKIIHLITRKDDISAQCLYKKMGFEEINLSDEETEENNKNNKQEPPLNFILKIEK